MLKDLNQEQQQAPEKCAACGTHIRDRYYLLTSDQAWHVNCLRCCQCSQNLDTELSCYSRDGLIYCKEDYYRIFSIRRCARCGAGISSSDLVMRARDLVFHVNCFSCALCGLPLSAGDTAGIRGGRIFCCEHYETELQLETTNIPLQQIPYFPPTTQQKGRPRKRKPLQSDETIINAGSDNHTAEHIVHENRLELLNASELASTGSMDMSSSYDGSQSPRSAGAMTPTSRNKRMRTSFKHHQLRTMKSYFAINQNPDAKDLKQLAQKTGLSKRVLQVWFQNARAKWRRNMMRGQDGNSSLQNPNCPSNITSFTSNEIHTPNSSESDMTPSHSHALEEMHNMTFAELY
ncbi:hypothetical protein PVAND_006710 [Polypedilum vanderplanki]|uniref:Uncharacterized protein n=1 Tax=Polypedilum vanderplanki TaxID=319348 RepID=A0A9J6C510_POLVA|nr:hypothetical protein PVAND_006710 [Polypedilum vanderplanki]